MNLNPNPNITTIDNPNPQSPNDLKSEVLQDVYLRYLIDEETKFANIDKIESYYKETIYQRLSKFNDNQLKLQIKRLEYNRLITDLITEAMDSYVFPKETLLSLITSEIEDIREQIRVRTINIERYRNMFNRLYHTHYMIKRRIEIEMNYIALNSKQYCNYSMIRKEVVNETKEQRGLLSTVNEYYNKENRRKKGCITRQMSKVNVIENEAEVIKANNIQMKKAIDALREKRLGIEVELIGRQKANVFDRNLHWNRKRVYYKGLYDLLLRLKVYKVKHPNELIASVKDIQARIQIIYINFIKANEDINELNNEYRMLVNRLKNYNRQIILRCNHYNAEHGKGNDLPLPNITANQSNTSKTQNELNNLRSMITNLQKYYDKKFLVFQICFRFLIECCRKLSKLNQARNAKYTNSDTVLSFIMEDRHIKQNDIDSNNDSIIPFICKLLQCFFNSFFHCLFRAFDHITWERLLYLSNSDNANLCILYIFSKEDLVLFKELSVKANSNIKARLKYLKKNEDNLFVSIFKKDEYSFFKSNDAQGLKNNKLKLKDQNQKISQKELLNSFRNHLEKTYYKHNSNSNSNSNSNGNGDSNSLSFTNRSYFDNYPRRILAILSKYQNDLVIKDEDNTEDTGVLSSRVNGNYGRFTAKKKKAVNKIQLKKRANSTSIRRNSNNISYDCDSYDNGNGNEYNSQRENNMNKSSSCIRRRLTIKNQLGLGATCGDEQMAKIYRRFNDLRSLKLKYKDKEGSNPNEMIELFKSFKSKIRNSNSLNKNNSNKDLKLKSELISKLFN